MCLLIVVFLAVVHRTQCDNFNYLNLSPAHVPYFLNNFPELKEKCLKDDDCVYKEELQLNRCWGYEKDCDNDKRFSKAHCPEDYKWVQSKDLQLDTFYRQADFGYVQQQLQELSHMCLSESEGASSLECSEHLRFCRGKNIMINFTSLASREKPVRYDMDVLSDGDIGGYCKFFKSKLIDQTDHMSPLQSWAPELRYFTELKEPIGSDCQIVVDKPAYILKIDATVNMYHHFCDFFNLYASQHVNSTHPEAFSRHNQILIWESYPYISNFADTWEAFTENKIWNLNNVKGKTVCFKDVVFPLLPRMIFGLFYNTPFMMGCERSGLFKAFSEHILHRLRIPLTNWDDNKIRITFLSRNTAYRNVLNEDALIKKLRNRKEFQIQLVIFNKNMPFKKQLEVIRNSDIFIGMHGAGLTHLLFLPDWAVVFELYNCEDANCYKDLARLRGIKYMTWEDESKVMPQDAGHHPNGGAHAKFTNYQFDVNEFVRLVRKAAAYVKINRPIFGPLHDEL